MAAAAITPSTEPPIPMVMWTPLSREAAAMPAEMSPSAMSLRRAPAARI